MGWMELIVSDTVTDGMLRRANYLPMHYLL